ncbi:hypothetical protein SLEP1_g5440 [Rubroshorea leprosula]|uniref:Uncharacterized protein n=1 Tax=Rubroshorea leprosula TaxID=152421 RepID=A0AAV5I2J8_9ROSI|nr:hypothetical protein SLEP1_g5440 [Rubroshorea leprosula]
MQTREEKKEKKEREKRISSEVMKENSMSCQNTGT